MKPSTQPPKPFTRSTFGNGGVPEGQIPPKGKRIPGGRHRGALLADPETTEQRLSKERAKPKD